MLPHAADAELVRSAAATLDTVVGDLLVIFAACRIE